jgi:hypothetical protein
LHAFAAALESVSGDSVMTFAGEQPAVNRANSASPQRIQLELSKTFDPKGAEQR